MVFPYFLSNGGRGTEPVLKTIEFALIIFDILLFRFLLFWLSMVSILISHLLDGLYVLYTDVTNPCIMVTCFWNLCFIIFVHFYNIINVSDKGHVFSISLPIKWRIGQNSPSKIEFLKHYCSLTNYKKREILVLEGIFL